MSVALQTSIDGREVPLEVVRRRYAGKHNGRRTVNQAMILQALRLYGEIRSVQAGVIVHYNRGHCGFGARGGRVSNPKAIGCCAYAAIDGLACLKRMAERGLVFRDPDQRGRWLAP